MGISVRAARRRTSRGHNWVVTDDYNDCGNWWDVPHTCAHVIREYTCTNWTDAMRIADDLVRDRPIDPQRVIALSEWRV